MPYSFAGKQTSYVPNTVRLYAEAKLDNRKISKIRGKTVTFTCKKLPDCSKSRLLLMHRAVSIKVVNESNYTKPNK